MIYIEKTKINNFVLTLSESSRISNPNFLFVFENEFIIDSTPIIWSQVDSSSYTNRYNQFQLVESAIGSTTGGTANALSLRSGQYSYKVYESTTPTLIVSGTTGRIIETGRMIVTGDINDTLTNNKNSIYI
jgi:hypothetical protein